MKHHRREIFIAIAAATLLVAAGDARSERLWTDKAIELRSSPGDEAQVVRKVQKGKSLEVLRRLGTWVLVEFDGRNGWIRRSELSSKPKDDGGDDSRDGKDAPKAVADDPDMDDDGKAEAPSEKDKARTDKAKAKKERRRARAKTEKVGKGKVAAADGEDEDEEADEERPSRKPRSSWGGRDAPGSVMKVEIQALSAQAFSEPNGRGRVVFTVEEGDKVRVVARGENRWLLVDNGKKKTGWIPAAAVRDSGKLVDARGDEDDTEVAGAAASDGGDEEGEDGETDSESAAETSASVGASTPGLDERAERPWNAVVALRAGYTAVGMDTAPDAGDDALATYGGPTAGLVVDFDYRLTPKIAAVVGLSYDWSTALGGLTYETATPPALEDIKLAHHRAWLTAGAAYGTGWKVDGRVGYYYSALQIDDLANPASLPREQTKGPTVGLGFKMAEVASTKLGFRIGVDALILGSRDQTAGLRDGTDFDSLTAVWAAADVHYPIGENLSVGGGYRYGYATSTWTGMSERIDTAMTTDRTDQAHEITVGAGWRL